MTLREMADKASIPYYRIANQRSLLRIPTAEDIMNIAIALNTSSDFLLFGNDIENNVCPEAEAVKLDPNLQALVRAVQRDPRLLEIIGSVVASSEEHLKEA